MDMLVFTLKIVATAEIGGCVKKNQVFLAVVSVLMARDHIVLVFCALLSLFWMIWWFSLSQILRIILCIFLLGSADSNEVISRLQWMVIMSSIRLLCCHQMG